MAVKHVETVAQPVTPCLHQARKPNQSKRFAAMLKAQDPGTGSLCPVLPIGAENLPGKVAAQGSAVAQQPTRRRRALDGDLARRDDARHGGRAARGFAWRGVVCCVTAGHHRPGGSGDGRPASARRARQRPHARGRGLSRRPGRGQTPPLPVTPSAWWCCPSQFTLSRSASSRASALSAVEARRWRAEGAPLKP